MLGRERVAIRSCRAARDAPLMLIAGITGDRGPSIEGLIALCNI
jgi:hypothetical protein